MLELISLKGYYFGPEGTGYGVDFNPENTIFAWSNFCSSCFSSSICSQSGYNVIYNVIVRVMITFSEAIW